jgi:hypothetical protein
MSDNIFDDLERARAERRRKRENAWTRNTDAALIIPSSAFTNAYTPPDYVFDGILRRRFVYSLTGYTGGGKTAVALYISGCVAHGWPIARREIDKGRVLYLAGENDEDVRMRWIAMGEAMRFDVAKAEVYFIPCRFPISENIDRLKKEAAAIGSFDLVVVDTCAAYFEGDDDNHNVQMGNHARTLRELTTLPGGPCVLIPSHPSKGASNDNLVPRGGSAFLFEVDGNLVCKKTESIIDLHHHAKFRGPEFEPISFELVALTSERLKDSKGRLAHTVMARPITGGGEGEDRDASPKRRGRAACGHEQELRRINCRHVQGARLAD